MCNTKGAEFKNVSIVYFCIQDRTCHPFLSIVSPLLRERPFTFQMGELACFVCRFYEKYLYLKDAKNNNHQILLQYVSYRDDITEILLKVALNTITLTPLSVFNKVKWSVPYDLRVVYQQYHDSVQPM